MPKKKVLLIPFDKDGNLVDYVGTKLSPEQKGRCESEGFIELYVKDIWPGIAQRSPERKDEVACVFRPNNVFEDTLVMTGYVRGTSAVRIVFVLETTGKTADMFLADFAQAVLSSRVDYTDKFQQGIRITGRFTYVKRGQEYGIRKIEEKNNEF